MGLFVFNFYLFLFQPEFLPWHACSHSARWFSAAALLPLLSADCFVKKKSQSADISLKQKLWLLTLIWWCRRVAQFCVAVYCCCLRVWNERYLLSACLYGGHLGKWRCTGREEIPIGAHKLLGSSLKIVDKTSPLSFSLYSCEMNIAHRCTFCV